MIIYLQVNFEAEFGPNYYRISVRIRLNFRFYNTVTTDAFWGRITKNQLTAFNVER